MTDIDHPDPGRKKIISLYIAFGVMLALFIVPHIAAAILSIPVMFLVLVAAYMMRSGAAAESFVYNHATYIIRTVWIGSFLASITVIAASVYLFYTLDNAPLMPCLDRLISVDPEKAVMMIDSLFGPCYAPYLSANLQVFIIGGVIAAGAPLVYFVLRYAKGFSRAIKGYRVAKPTAWV